MFLSTPPPTASSPSLHLASHVFSGSSSWPHLLALSVGFLEPFLALVLHLCSKEHPLPVQGPSPGPVPDVDGAQAPTQALTNVSPTESIKNNHKLGWRAEHLPSRRRDGMLWEQSTPPYREHCFARAHPKTSPVAPGYTETFPLRVMSTLSSQTLSVQQGLLERPPDGPCLSEVPAAHLGHSGFPDLFSLRFSPSQSLCHC